MSNPSRTRVERNITLDDLIAHIGDSPICYLTGRTIDITKPRTYQFDHKLPRSKGGENSLDNLGITTKEANQAKHNMTEEEFVQLCKDVLVHRGYSITTPD